MFIAQTKEIDGRLGKSKLLNLDFLDAIARLLNVGTPRSTVNPEEYKNLSTRIPKAGSRQYEHFALIRTSRLQWRGSD